MAGTGKRRLPAEWEEQSGVQLTWPHSDTEWYQLDKVLECYVDIAYNILRFEPLMIVARDIEEAKSDIAGIAEKKGISIDMDKIMFHQSDLNDTWARDHGAVSVFGEKGENLGVDMRPFVLEGGSIDSDGQGTLLTTTECLCSMNRNEYLDKNEIENELKTAFGLDRVLWLDFGHIAGDDTDSHVDTLARFCSPDTIAYVSCEDINDPQYEEFSSMMLQLQSFRTPEGKPYRLVPLPFADPIYLDGYRLPATYANFLIINGAVLVPGTGSPKDETARKTLQEVFPDREVTVIDCRALLSGHGALHCVTMQYPKGFLRTL